jgi:hypothetical protein
MMLDYYSFYHGSYNLNEAGMNCLRLCELGYVRLNQIQLGYQPFVISSFLADTSFKLPRLCMTRD